MKIRAKSLCVFILATLIHGTLYSQQVETKDGIRIIHNNKTEWGTTPLISLKLIRTIGGIDIQDGNFVFISPRGLAMDSDMNIYIPDYSDNRIQKFNSEAEYLETIGEGGQGPGDFNHPFSIDIDSDDNLYVLDSTNRRIQIFNKKTELIEIIKYRKFRQHNLRVRDSNTVALGAKVPMSWVMNETEGLPKLIEIMDKEGNIVEAFGEMTDYENRLVNSHANWFDFDVDNDGNYYLSFRYQNRIDRYNPKGELLWQADRVLNYGTKVLDKGDINTSGGGFTIRSPNMNRVSNGIAVDENYRVWILTYNRQMLPEEITQITGGTGVTKVTHQGVIKKMDMFKLEIFNTEGILLGEILLNHLANGIRIQKNYVFIWDVENVQYYQYRMIEH